MKMKCGHKVLSSSLEKQDGFAYIQYTCIEGCKTDWASVGECPYCDEIEIKKD